MMKTWIDPVVNAEPPVAISESFAEFQKRIIEQMCNSLSIPKDILSQSNANYSFLQVSRQPNSIDCQFNSQRTS